jgi:hypothetical protein
VNRRAHAVDPLPALPDEDIDRIGRWILEGAFEKTEQRIRANVAN